MLSGIWHLCTSYWWIPPYASVHTSICLEGLTELTVDNGQEHHPTWKWRRPDRFSLCELPCVGEPPERSSAIHVAEPSSISKKKKPCKSSLLSRERHVQVTPTFPCNATHECACKQIHKACSWLMSLRTLTNWKSAVEDHKLTGLFSHSESRNHCLGSFAPMFQVPK